jgi:F-type H+-transporting ATPase subunit epsilon
MDQSEKPAAAGVLRCVIVTPEATVVDTQAGFVALPLFDGEIGIAPLHSPMIGRLGYGEMRIRDGAQTRSYYVDGGFVQVADNVVSVLTNRALPAESLDAAVAAEHLEHARAKPASGEEAIVLRQQQIDQARAQLRVVRRQGAPS